MTSPGEPIRSPGVWGLVGRVKKDMEVHYCEDGKTLCMKNGKHRLLHLQLNNWNPDNLRTCPKCKEIRDIKLIESKGAKQSNRAF